MRSWFQIVMLSLLVSVITAPTTGATFGEETGSKAKPAAGRESAESTAAEPAEGRDDGPQKSPARTTVPEENLEVPEKMQACAANLRKIYAAIEEYRKDKEKLPDWLSDLVPDYLEKEALLCRSSQRQRASFWPDPKLPCSFTYEFSPARLSGNWGAVSGMVCRDWKARQVKLFGEVVPLVRCRHGSRVLNLPVGGQVYWSPGDWEPLFMPDYRRGDELPRDEQPFDYTLPTDDVDELFKFITDLKEFRPETPRQTSEHSRRAPAALKAAALRILKLEEDQWSEPFQAALRILLEDRVRTVRGGNPARQRETVKFVKDFLTANLQEKKLDSQDCELAMSAAKALEDAGNHHLAVEAYGEFAKLITKSEDETLLETVKVMEGAVRRIELVTRAMAHVEDGEFEKAITDYTEVIEHYAQDSIWYQRRANAYVAVGELDKAIGDYTKVIADGPDRAQNYIARGKAYRKKGNLDAALADFGEAIRLQPTNARCYCARAQCYLQGKDLGSVVEDYNAAVRLFSRYHDLALARKEDIQSANQHPLITGESPFGLKAARIRTTGQTRELLWQEFARLTWPDFLVFDGYQPVHRNHPFLVCALAQVRGELRPGFVMHSLEVDALHAEWDVSLPKGTRLRINWALTEMAVRTTTNGLEFSCIATDKEGVDHVVVEQTLRRGDKKMYEREHQFDYAVEKLRFVHDNLGNGSGDDLWICPETQRPH